MLRDEHYLIQDGYTLAQKKAMEADRIKICVACATEARSIKELAYIVGIYHALRVVNDLVNEGHLLRFYRKSTGELTYKFNTEGMRLPKVKK